MIYFFPLYSVRKSCLKIWVCNVFTICSTWSVYISSWASRGHLPPFKLLVSPSVWWMFTETDASILSRNGPGHRLAPVSRWATHCDCSGHHPEWHTPAPPQTGHAWQRKLTAKIRVEISLRKPTVFLLRHHNLFEKTKIFIFSRSSPLHNQLSNTMESKGEDGIIYSID